MINLVEILNHLISVDEECQRTLEQLKEKQENIEYLVNEELSKRKDEIKTKYKFKLDMRKNEYEMKLAQNLQQIETEKNQKLQELETKYQEQKQQTIDTIMQAIVEEK